MEIISKLYLLLFVISESLGMSGVEKAYSLFGVTGCKWEYIELNRFFKTVWLFCFFGLFPRSKQEIEGKCGRFKGELS